jgi:hypothetical protein
VTLTCGCCCCRFLCCLSHIGNHADEKVKAAKEQLQKAMADSDSAWIAYVNDYGAGSVMNLIAGERQSVLNY